MFSNISISDDTSKVELKIILEALPACDRMLIYMKYYLGYTLDEIAGIMDMPPGSVRTNIYGNLKKLRDEMNTGGAII